MDLLRYLGPVSVPEALRDILGKNGTVFGPQGFDPRTLQLTPIIDTTVIQAFDAESAQILEVLANAHPRLMINVDIEGATRLSKATVASRVRALIEGGFAARPRGDRKGTTTTEKGMAAYESLNEK